VALEEFNRDINTPNQFVGAYPRLEMIISNPELANAFRHADRRARIWKFIFQTDGYVTLGATGIALVMLAFRLTVGLSPKLAAPSVALGALGLFGQLVFILVKPKERWLIWRFGAERFRCLKFQLYLVALTETECDVAQRVIDITMREIANISLALSGGMSAISSFSSAGGLISVPDGPFTTDRTLIEEIQESYRAIRLRVQRQHLLSALAKIRKSQAMPELIAQTGFLVSSILALVDLGWNGHVKFYGGNDLPVAFHCIVLSTFIISACVYVFRHGQAFESHVARYHRFEQLYAHLEARWDSDDGALQIASHIRRCETLCLEELESFCGTVERSSYSL
jgi:hypothetical protein